MAPFGKVKADQIESSTQTLNVDDLATTASAVPTARQVATGAGLIGGGDLSANRSISADVASQAEAEAGSNSSKLMTPQRTAQAIAALAASPTVLYNRRPALQRGSLFYKTAATTISVVAGAVLNGKIYATATAVTMPGSHTNNTDYAIWQNATTGALVADASFTTAPAGATGGSIVGGYHYVPSGRPTAVNNGSPTAAAEILEFSLWDLTWRPACPDPRGMVCIEGGFWMDLYLCGATSYAGSTFSAVPSSRIGLTIADGSSPPLVPAQYGGNGSTAYANGKWFTFAEVAASFGKRLPRWQEFSAAAFGAPEASSRGTDPGTVQWERVSKFGLAQATGVMWQWGQETCSAGAPSAWTAGTETDSRGQVYGPETRAVILGGNWSITSLSGSRCADWSASPWGSASVFGARFAAVATAKHHHALLFLWGSRPVPTRCQPSIPASANSGPSGGNGRE